ncbi:hypothetical protein IFM89_032411 [Coptis chinensis]|uniref:Filament-like plant protein 4 n=1 Tax=Coptis chinensis TaxID=261450 RepID=A0A835M5H0_9MAGN|nr:hypothetical protein IFM89_032411 [Coptis chinensis]
MYSGTYIQMDRRWWKKKSSDKTAEKAVSAADSAGTSLASVGSQGDQEKPKKPSYVQVSVETYAHLTGLENEIKTLNDHVKTLNEEVDILNEKLSSAHSEIDAKETVVKQHTKVAEEAVSGWEKAEAEALALKHQLEAVTLLKLTAEDRASHLDGALKECMKQILSKELDIRNEEKNMSMRSAEVANKQHLEGVKKIAKLEAECQRLRGLVRKKLPGPAALAQMKLEVESLGRDYGETRMRRSPVQSPSQHLAPPPEFSLENVQKFHKENEFLMGRCLAMEEEMKMLKEALAKRNSELQASRNMCAKTMSKLRSLEAQLQSVDQQRSSSRLNVEMPVENESNPPSSMSLSEDGMDEEGSCTESWATTLVSELSQFKKGRNNGKPVKAENMNQLELMDDFLEMERLACSTEPNGPAIVSDSPSDKKTENEDHCSMAVLAKTGDVVPERQPETVSSSMIFSREEQPSAMTESDADKVSLTTLRSRISMIFRSEEKDADMRRILNDIKCVMQDMQDALPQNSANCILEDTHSSSVSGNQVSIQHNEERRNGGSPINLIIDQELTRAIYQIHDFVVSMGKEAMTVHDIASGVHDIIRKSEEFSDSVNNVLCSKISLGDFILNLSNVLAKASDLSINLFGSKSSEVENISSDCVDKVTLLEKKVVQDDSFREKFPNGCAHISHSTSDPEVLREGSLSPGSDLKFVSCKCSLEELEHLKTEKDNMEMELSRCTQNLEQSECQLQETQQLLTELKLQLVSSQKSNCLAETQLKCMAESYNTLETRAQELGAEVSSLRAKVEALDVELQKEKQNHQDAWATCKELEEQLQRSESCSVCALSSTAETDEKSQKEKEIAAATEKLAECQETIFLLGRQLKALGPSEHTESPHHERQQALEDFMEGKRSPSRLNPLYSPQDSDNSDMETIFSSIAARVGSESPSEVLNSSIIPSDADLELIMRSPVSSKRPKHRPTKSSSSSSSATTPEKQSRGISRFFSSK